MDLLQQEAVVFHVRENNLRSNAGELPFDGDRGHSNPFWLLGWPWWRCWVHLDGRSEHLSSSSSVRPSNPLLTSTSESMDFMNFLSLRRAVFGPRLRDNDDTFHDVSIMSVESMPGGFSE
jgi:hypothetical protein